MIYKNGKHMRDFFGLFVFIVVFYSLSIFWGIFNKKIIIPLVLVGYEMTIANLALCTFLAIYYLTSNARSWNNC